MVVFVAAGLIGITASIAAEPVPLGEHDLFRRRAWVPELAAIRCPGNDLERLDGMVRRLRPGEDKPDDWKRIIRDTTNYSVEYRLSCLSYLFERHVRTGMTLNEVAAILDGTGWADRAQVIYCAVIGGYIPLYHGIGESAFCIRLGSSPTSGVWLAAGGRLDGEQLRLVLTGLATPELDAPRGEFKVTDLTIDHIHPFDPNLSRYVFSHCDRQGGWFRFR